jgi:recombination protein RecT
MANEVATTRQSPIATARTELEKMTDQFRYALPHHIPVERFSRVVMTAIQNNQDLVTADRGSLWNAAMRAAQDGLLPDGREGAMVIFNTKKVIDGKDQWVKAVQWMPMITGIIKKCRNSGQIAGLVARVVYGGDKFRYWIDDTGEHCEYEPSDNPDTSIVRRVFAMARTKDGEIYVEPLTAADIEKIRNVSKSKDRGPWVDWWEEMAKKSALRRLAKRLPQATDLDDLVRRDDHLYDIDGGKDGAKASAASGGMASRLDAMAGIASDAPMDSKPGAPADGDEHVDPQTGEVTKNRGGRPVGSKNKPKEPEMQQQASGGTLGATADQQRSAQEAAAATQQANPPGEQTDAEPGKGGGAAPIPTFKNFETIAAGKDHEAKTKAGVDYIVLWKEMIESIGSPEEAAACKTEYYSMPQKSLRNALNPPEDGREEIMAALKATLDKFPSPPTA